MVITNTGSLLKYDYFLYTNGDDFENTVWHLKNNKTIIFKEI